MTILFFDWKSYGKEHIVKALEELGHKVDRVSFDHEKDNDDLSYEGKAVQLLSYNYYDMVFSSNYFPTIAKACHENRVIYISWLYDSPFTPVWDATAYYPECYIFSFDQKQCEGLKKEGIRQVYYMPLAAEAEVLDGIQATEEQIERFQGDVSFVGSLYDKKSGTEKILKNADLDFLRGYGDAVIDAQTKVQGANFLEEVLEPEDINILIKNMNFKNQTHGSMVTKTMIYANYFLAQAVTFKERTQMVKSVSDRFNMTIYSHSKTNRYKKIVNKGFVDYYFEMPLVFRYSKINLNMTLRSIQTGIPLRAWDIMASGGFLLTNYQADFLKHFEPGVDFDYFVNEEDMLNKIEYYLKNEEVRIQIAKNGYEKVKKYHSYKLRLQDMFQIVEEGEGWK